MKRQQIEELIEKASEKASKFIWVKDGYAHSPYISKFATLEQHQHNVVYYAVYSLISNPEEQHTVVLSYYNNQYVLRCGDAYLEGRMSMDTKRTLVNSALKTMKKGVSSKISINLNEGFSITPRSKPCDFNKKNYEDINPICSHVSHFLSELPEDVLDTLETMYYESHVGQMHEQELTALTLKLNKYAFRKHVLIEGEKGSGKTYHALGWGDDSYEKVYVGGHEQFESIDFLGHYIQQESGTLVWKDGALTEAFRKAEKGKQTILIIDEMLRIPKRELNILVSSLSPFHGKFRLRTGRAKDVIDGVAVEEVITIPADKLWVIGTTNVGAGYAVEQIDEALLDRFRPVRQDTTESELKQILMNAARDKQMGYQSVEKLMLFYTKMRLLVKSKVLSKIVNIRHLLEVIAFSDEEYQIRENLHESILLWVDRDYSGYPVMTQIDAVETAIESAWNRS
jgi:MoxR-like ATPase